MAVRQQDVSSSIFSILKKMDSMIDASTQIYERSYEVLVETKNIMRDSISNELKKQTSILMSIESKLKEKFDVAGENSRNSNSNFSQFSIDLGKIIKSINKLDGDASKKMESLFTVLSDGFSKFSKEDLNKIKILGDLSSKILSFGGQLALYSIIALPAIVGATLFGITIKNLLSVVKNIKDDKAGKTIKLIIEFSNKILIFGLSMALFVPIAPLAIIGAKLFGISINSLFSALKGINIENTKSMDSILDLGERSLLFGLSMALFVPIAPLAIIGAKLFGIALNSLLSYIIEVDIKGIKDVLDLTKGILLFGLSMSLYAVIGIPAMIGSVLFGLSIRLLVLALGTIDKKDLDAIKGLIKLSLGILIFGATMVAVSIFSSNIIESSLIISASLLLIGLGLFVMGNPQVKKGTTTTLLSSLAIISLSLALFAFSQLVDPLNALLSAAIILGLGISFGILGKFASSIVKGSLVMILASGALFLIALGLVKFKEVNFTLEDAGILSGVIFGLGITMGLAGLAAPFIALGSAVMILSSLAIFAMTVALEKFQTLNWKKSDNENLKYTIKSVLGALSGTDEKSGLLDNITGAIGQGLQAFTSLFSIGPLLVGSAAIWLMSEALEKFKSVGWDPSQSESLSSAIKAVLGSLSEGASVASMTPGGAILDTILKLFSSGTIFVASGAIWLLSEALLKFKSVEWDPSLTESLSSTISMVLGSLTGGVATVSTNPGGSILNTILSLFSAGTLFVASGALWLFSSSLAKYKSINWLPEDNNLLSSTISSVLNSLTGGVSTVSVNPGGSILNTILSLMNSGTLLFASGAIWLLSEALLKFKSVKWSKADAASLTYTINSVTSIMSGTEEGGGLFSKISSAAKSLIKGALGAGNATTLGISSLSILALSEALLKWKSIGWGPGQSNNLKIAIQSILNVLTSKEFLDFDNGVVEKRLQHFTNFVSNIENLSKTSQEWSKIANNLNKIQTSVKLTKDHINAIDLKKLTLTDSLMKSLAIISKNPESIAKAIDGSISKAFEDFANVIREIAGENKEAQKELINAAVNSTGNKTMMIPGISKSAPPVINQSVIQPTESSISPEDLKYALASAIKMYFDSNTIKVKTSIF